MPTEQEEIEQFRKEVRPAGADLSMRLWSTYCVPVLNQIDRFWNWIWEPKAPSNEEK